MLCSSSFICTIACYESDKLEEFQRIAEVSAVEISSTVFTKPPCYTIQGLAKPDSLTRFLMERGDRTVYNE